MHACCKIDSKTVPWLAIFNPSSTQHHLNSMYKTIYHLLWKMQSEIRCSICLHCLWSMIVEKTWILKICHKCQDEELSGVKIIFICERAIVHSLKNGTSSKSKCQVVRPSRGPGLNSLKSHPTQSRK